MWHSFGLCHNTLTPEGTPRLLHYNVLAFVWPVSQYTDARRNTKATALQCSGLCLACVTIHWRQKEHPGYCITMFWPLFGLCHNTLTPEGTPRLLHYNVLAFVWPVSQFTDASRNTKATALQCSGLCLGCVTIHWRQQEHQGYCITMLLRTAQLYGYYFKPRQAPSVHKGIHPPEREINPLKTVCRLPKWRGYVKQPHTWSSHPMERTCPRIPACVLGDPQNGQLGEVTTTTFQIYSLRVFIFILVQHTIIKHAVHACYDH